MKTATMSRFAPSLIFLLFVLGPLGRAEEVLREISWDKPDKVGERQGMEWLPPDDTASFPLLKVEDMVENLGSEPLRVNILSLEKPGVTLANYALRGQVRTEGVEGQGFLEMWSHFPGDGQFFSRTLGSEGPMRHLEGSCDWRPFLLPFQNKPDGPPPERLVVNVVLPGKGKVWIGPLTLVQFLPEENPLLARGQWFGPETQGWIGACVGALGGTLGTLIRWRDAGIKARSPRGEESHLLLDTSFPELAFVTPSWAGLRWSYYIGRHGLGRFQSAIIGSQFNI
jgi:hypothetical protein